MDRETYDALAKVRIERAKELLEEAKILLESIVNIGASSP